MDSDGCGKEFPWGTCTQHIKVPYWKDKFHKVVRRINGTYTHDWIKLYRISDSTEPELEEASSSQE
jgi:hypothetical protein